MTTLDNGELLLGADTALTTTAINIADGIASVDQSLYTCPTCLGTGLIGDPKDPAAYTCPRCLGSGKQIK